VASPSLLPVGWGKAAEGSARLIINWAKALSGRHRTVFLLYELGQPLVGRVSQERMEIEPKYIRKHVRKRFLLVAISSKTRRRYKPTMSKFGRIISKEELAPAAHRMERTRQRLGVSISSRLLWNVYIFRGMRVLGIGRTCGLSRVNRGTGSGDLRREYFGALHSRQRKRKVCYMYMMWRKASPYFSTRVRRGEYSGVRYRMILTRLNLISQLTKT